jgi:hypothetical protein
MQENKIFPVDKRAKLLQALSQQGPQRVPIVLFFHRERKWKGLKQYMLVTIEPESSLHHFFKTVEAKLIWAGYLDDNNRALHLYIKQKQLTINGTSPCI